jgi:hypothetical protein
MSFPNSINVQGTTFTNLKELSQYFKTKARWNQSGDKMTLTKRGMFNGDEHFWRMFVDLFVPEKAPQIRQTGEGTFQLMKAFNFNSSGRFTLNELAYSLEDVYALFDFLLISEEDKPAVLKYLTDVHYWYQGKPNPPALKLKTPLRQYSNELSLTPSANEEEEEEEEEEEKLNIGFANKEEENLYAKLSGTNLKRFAPSGGKKKTRKLKRNTS